MDDFPMFDELDHEILMHRDAHFGGSFSLMHEYYVKEGKGIRPEISLERIEELQNLENSLKINLADEILFDLEKEAVVSARQKYNALRQLYSEKETTLARQIADLIFSEEEDPSQEITAVAAYGAKAVFSLIELLKSEDFYNPLFPGLWGSSRFSPRAAWD